MVEYTEFMSIAMNKCGSDGDTFAALAAVWSREKEQIKEMSAAEVREDLRCP